MPLPNMNSFVNASIKDRSIGERIWQCDKDDLHFLMSIGGTNGGVGKFQFNAIAQDFVKWYSTGDRPTSTTLVGSHTAPTTTGDDAYGNAVYPTKNVTVADGSIYYPTMVLELVRNDGQNPEFWMINSVSGNVLNVTCGWRGTPVYSYSNGQLINMLTIVAEECAVPQYLSPRGFSSDENYFQIFTHGMEDTLRRQRLMNYFLPYDPYEEEMRRVMGGAVNGRSYTGMLPKMLEQTALYGIKGQAGPNGDASMGGLNSFPINQMVSATWNYKYFTKTIIKMLYKNGANIPNLYMLVSPDVAESISEWGEGVYTSEQGSSKVGIKITTIVTQYGEITPVVHRHLRPNEIYLYDPMKIGMVEGWGWTESELPSDSALCEKKQIHGCFTMAVSCPDQHVRIRLTGTGFDAWQPDVNPAPAESTTYPDEHGVVV